MNRDRQAWAASRAVPHPQRQNSQTSKAPLAPNNVWIHAQRPESTPNKARTQPRKSPASPKQNQTLPDATTTRANMFKALKRVSWLAGSEQCCTEDIGAEVGEALLTRDQRPKTCPGSANPGAHRLSVRGSQSRRAMQPKLGAGSLRLMAGWSSTARTGCAC